MSATDLLDSRALGPTDAWGQRFMREGTFRYAVQRAGTATMIDEYPLNVVVQGERGKKKMKQHLVMLHHDPARGTWRPEKDTIEIRSGDLVLWACREPGTPPFEIVGEKEFLRSARMINECGYAHAFASAGTYEWRDANGSGLGGRVIVRDPPCRSAGDLEKWRQSLAEGALVMIDRDRAEPERLEILTGQTVYFAIVQASGVTVTDERLLKVGVAVDGALERFGSCSR